MRMPALTNVNKLQRFLSECLDPSRTLRHDTACFHVPPMDDRSEGRINGCTRDGCNSFLIACRRRKLHCLSLTFALTLSLAPWGVTHVVTIHVQVSSWISARSRSHHVTLHVFLPLSTKCFETHRSGIGVWHGRFFEDFDDHCGEHVWNPRQWCQGLVLVRPNLNRSTRKGKHRNVAWPY